ncbi:MAG: PilX N-terminal domain-containing pilus assembly protein [Rhodoferax sp.]
MSRPHFSSRSSQRASVLITTMILLIMLTLLGLSLISLNSTQTRVATNSADAQEAYQTAEGALNQAAQALQSGAYTYNNLSINANGLYTDALPSSAILSSASAPLWPAWTQAQWNNPANAIQCTTCGAGKNAAYFIEALPPTAPPGATQKPNQNVYVYRITAHAVGSSGNSPVTLQGTVLAPN